jgi:hypothetical protein
MTIDAAPDGLSSPQDEKTAMGMFMMMAGPWFPSIAFRTPPKRRIVTIVTMGMNAEPLFLQLVWLFPLPTKEAR